MTKSNPVKGGIRELNRFGNSMEIPWTSQSFYSLRGRGAVLQSSHLAVVSFARGGCTSGLVLGRTDLENPDLDVSIDILGPVSSQATPCCRTYFILGFSARPPRSSDSFLCLAFAPG